MKFIFVLLAITSSSLGHVASDRDRISFGKEENGLPWPLPNADSVDMIMVHVSHCIREMVEEKDNNTLHNVHCWNTVKRALHFLETHSSNKVDQWLCDTFQPHRMKTSKYGINYGRIWEVRYSLGWGGKKKRAVEQNQDEQYVGLQVKHVADLLIKRMKHPESLSKTEAAYLGRLESDRAVAASAVALYCATGGNLEIVRKALKDNESAEKLIH